MNYSKSIIVVTMKILFVSAGNKNGDPREVVKNQGESLITEGIELRFFCITGGGLNGYLNALPLLKKEIKTFNPDVIHAHYSLSGFLASLAGARRLVVSLMGSEVNSAIHRLIIKLFISSIWKVTIVKSAEMASKLNAGKTIVIPNGVNINRFRPVAHDEAIRQTVLEEGKKNIIFVANPLRREKNFGLAETAVKMMRDENVILTAVFNTPNKDLVFYYNAADVLILTSVWEGSPNVIKEAMACNCPIVSTKVGDIHSLLGETEGTYLTSDDSEDVAEKLTDALMFAEKKGRTAGARRIIDLGLDSVSVSQKLISVYKNVIASY